MLGVCGVYVWGLRGDRVQEVVPRVEFFFRIRNEQRIQPCNEQMIKKTRGYITHIIKKRFWFWF